ncbi:MAG: HAD-IC family P-type ATPase, partial [Methylococcaceae bacterium]|nr:HAD-IC family P-type ATPase [Methylococcaceae bacterium]
MNALPSAPPQPGQLPTLQIVHQNAPGRLRIKVSSLYRSERTKARLEDQIVRIGSVDSVTANPLTGTVLICFDATAVAVNELLADVEALTFSTLIDAPVRTPPPTPSRRTGRIGLEPGLSRFKRPLRQPRLASPSAAAPAAETQPEQAWHGMDGRTALALLQTSMDGLTSVAVRERLRRYGTNTLGEARARSQISMFAGQFMSIPVAMLGASAVVSIATGGLVDAAVIGGVVLINAIIGFATESSAERTINALGSLTPGAAWVIRDGRRLSVPVAEVAVGDLLVLTPGSYIPADARLLTASELTVDESALTGESLPVAKQADHLCDAETPLGERRNMVHRGTVVTGGSGLALATATGAATEIGRIQALVGEVAPPDTPMQRQLDRMGIQLAALSGAICLGVFGVGVLRGYGWMQMMNSCISLAVAAVPEGLPAVATTTLALGIQQMRQRQVLIRKLSAVESLGSVEVLCLDKTGTLTLNRMKVVALHTLRHHWELSPQHPVIVLGGSEAEAVRRLLEVVVLCSEVRWG